MQDFKIDVWFGCHGPDSILLEKKYELRNHGDILQAQNDFLELIASQYSDVSNTNKYMEKTYIIDYEAYLDDKMLGLTIGENPSELFEIFSAIEELSHLTDERVQLYIELADDFGHMNAVKKVQESLAVNLGNFHSKEFEIGHYFVNKLFSIELPEHIEPYFNYESYGKDLIFNNYTIEIGDYLFFIS